MRPRLLLLGVLLWLGVVLVGSGITWLVIDQVGRHVVTGQEPSGDASSGATIDVPPGSSPPASRTPAPGPSVTRSPPVATPSTAPVTRTWSGTGGRLTVSCTGTDATLVSASPADGWRVEVGSRGPGEVEVELKESAPEGADSQVRARCSGGEPRFFVEQDD